MVTELDQLLDDPSNQSIIAEIWNQGRACRDAGRVCVWQSTSYGQQSDGMDENDDRGHLSRTTQRRMKKGWDCNENGTRPILGISVETLLVSDRDYRKGSGVAAYL